MRTLRARIGWFIAAVLTLVLLLTAVAIYYRFALSEEQEDEPQAEKIRELHETRTGLLIVIGIALPLSLALGLGGGYLLTRRAMRTVFEIAKQAQERTSLELAEPLPMIPGAGEEFEDLVAALNGMLDRINRSSAGLRRFTADAAHELRTPLAILMNRLEIALRRPRDVDALCAVIGDSLEEMSRLARLVETLLTLAHSDAAAIPVKLAATDVEALVCEVCENYRAVASERGLVLTISPEEGTAEKGVHSAPLADKLLLRQALANLLDNACKFTKAAGEISVTIRNLDHSTEIVVRDSGPGLSPEEAMRAFERFYRSDRVRATTTGFGLGLPLARELIRAQKGELSVQTNGPGAKFVIALPRHNEPDAVIR